MREDDDEFRHYVPLLRRIIILVAVITAVPVVLWTITAFVRTYVGPPQIPTFHQLASISVDQYGAVRRQLPRRPTARPSCRRRCRLSLPISRQRRDKRRRTPRSRRRDRCSAIALRMLMPARLRQATPRTADTSGGASDGAAVGDGERATTCSRPPRWPRRTTQRRAASPPLPNRSRSDGNGRCRRAPPLRWTDPDAAASAARARLGAHRRHHAVERADAAAAAGCACRHRRFADAGAAPVRSGSSRISFH